MSTPRDAPAGLEPASSGSGSRRPAPSVTGATFIVSIGSLATLAVAVARSKVTAVLLGPTGVGQAAEVTQLVSLFVLVPIGIVAGPAFVRAIAATRADPAARQRAYDATWTAVAAGGVLLSGVAAVAAAAVFRDGGSALLALLGALGVAGATAVALPTQILIVEGDARRFALGSTLAAAITSGALVAGTLVRGLPGQFVAGAAAPLLVFAALAPMYRRALPGLAVRPRPRVDPALLRASVAVGTASLISGLTMQGALSVIRIVVARAGGVEANGQFQAAWAIDASLLTVVLQALGTVVFPRYAAASDGAALQAEVDSASRFVLRAVPPLLLAAVALRGIVIPLLFSSQFDEAVQMLGFILAGGLAKALASIQAGPLLYRGRVKAFLMSESIAALLLGGAPAVLCPLLGPRGAAIGYGLGYLGYVLVTTAVVSASCGLALPWRRSLAAVAFGLALGAVVWLLPSTPWVSAALLAAAAAWAVASGLLHEGLAFLRSEASRSRVS